jgi:hypothetical protein
MKDRVLIGGGEKIYEIPAENWRKHLTEGREHMQVRSGFMTEDHQRVRNFAVRELPRNQGKALSAAEISSRLDLSLDRVVTILEELQKNLFFLVLNEMGEVSWAFPVTSDRTPHRLSFSSGEYVFAA